MEKKKKGLSSQLSTTSIKFQIFNLELQACVLNLPFCGFYFGVCFSPIVQLPSFFSLIQQIFLKCSLYAENITQHLEGYRDRRRFLSLSPLQSHTEDHHSYTLSAKQHQNGRLCGFVFRVILTKRFCVFCLSFFHWQVDIFQRACIIQ